MTIRKLKALTTKFILQLHLNKEICEVAFWLLAKNTAIPELHTAFICMAFFMLSRGSKAQRIDVHRIEKIPCVYYMTV